MTALRAHYNDLQSKPPGEAARAVQGVPAAAGGVIAEAAFAFSVWHGWDSFVAKRSLLQGRFRQGWIIGKPPAALGIWIDQSQRASQPQDGNHQRSECQSQHQEVGEHRLAPFQA